jgi:hypothetical protein
VKHSGRRVPDVDAKGGGRGPMARAGGACGTACSRCRIRRLALWPGAAGALSPSAALPRFAGCATQWGGAGWHPGRDR